MRQYLDYLRHIKEHGTKKTDRTGTGTLSVFGYQMRFNLEEGFPLVTTKKTAMRSIIYELLWFLKGDANLRYLAENNVHIWDEWPYKAYLKKTGQVVPSTKSDEWKTGLATFIERIQSDDTFAKEHGDLGPIYGYQWRSWPNWERVPGKLHEPGGWMEPEHIENHPIDQITRVIEEIKNNPDSRRLIVSAWNVANIEEMAIAGLPPCHALFQFYVADGKLSCLLYQRSCDSFLGVPFNIASYALLLSMIAHVTKLTPGEFIWSGGDCHIYLNHLEQVDLQLSREPRPLPKLSIKRKVNSIFDFTFEDFEIADYDPFPAISAPIAV